MIPAYARPPTLNKVFIAFHISAVIYFLLGLVVCAVVPVVAFYSGSMGLGELIIIVGLGGFSILLGVGVEVVIWHLKKGKSWAWIAGICIAGIYIPSGFMPLGIIALLGLLETESKVYCGQGGVHHHVETFR